VRLPTKLAEQDYSFFRAILKACPYKSPYSSIGICFPPVLRLQTRLFCCAHGVVSHSKAQASLCCLSRFGLKSYGAHSKKSNCNRPVWMSAALKRLASAVRFRPWPPLLTVPVSNIYGRSCRSPCFMKVAPWSPFGVQTRSGRVRGGHGSPHGDHSPCPIVLYFKAMVPMVGMGTIFVVVSRMRRQQSMSYMRLPTHPSRLDSSVGVDRTFVAWGARGPGFKSRRPDQTFPTFTAFDVLGNARLESNRSRNSPPTPTSSP